MITQGKWEAANKGKGFDMNNMRHIFIKTDKFTIGRIDGYKDGKSCGHDAISMDEAVNNAALIAEAGTIYNETGFTPKQLAEQKTDLLSTLRYAVQFIDNAPSRKFIEQAIADAEKN